MHQENVWGRTALFHASGCDPERLERCAQEKMERCAHEMMRHRRSSQQYVKRDRQPREIVRALLAAGARVGGADSKGACALMSVEGDVERVRLLVGAGADVNQADAAGRSVLMRCMKAQETLHPTTETLNPKPCTRNPEP